MKHDKDQSGSDSGSEGEDGLRREAHSHPPPDDDRDNRDDGDARDDGLGGMPDLFRRAMEVGLSSFFATEGAIRRTVGDTLPQDWVDFAVGQGERTREDLVRGLTAEIGRAMDRIDLAEVISQALEGHTIEIDARVRLVRDEDPPTAPEADSSAAGGASQGGASQESPTKDAGRPKKAVRIRLRGDGEDGDG